MNYVNVTAVEIQQIKQKREMTKEEKNLDFLFDDIQGQIRLLKISLASAEKSYSMIEKLIKDKRFF